MEKDARERIMDEVQKLMRHQTIEAITTREICQNAGVIRQTFYNNFFDKYGVLECIYQRDYGKFHATLSQYDSLWAFFPRILENFYQGPRFYANAFRSHGQNSFREYCRRLLHPFLYREFRQTFTTDEQFEFFFTHFCEMTFSGIGLWLEKDPCPPPEEFSRDLEQVLLAHAKLHASLLEEALKNKTTDPDK